VAASPAPVVSSTSALRESAWALEFDVAASAPSGPRVITTSATENLLRIDPRTIVLDRKYPFATFPCARNVNTGRRRFAILDAIANQVVQNLRQYFEASRYRRQGVMRNNCATFLRLLLGAKKSLKYS